MPKFTFSRRAIYDEIYVVTAKTEEEAVEQLENGDHNPERTAFDDWYDDSYSLDDVEDELVTFLQSKETV